MTVGKAIPVWVEGVYGKISVLSAQYCEPKTPVKYKVYVQKKKK